VLISTGGTTMTFVRSSSSLLAVGRVVGRVEFFGRLSQLWNDRILD
jgi:hypothetical protein